jgi:hypothetical protein
MSCVGLKFSYPWAGYAVCWILLEYENGEAHWTTPCINCMTDICKHLSPDVRIVGRIEEIDMRQ